MLKCNECKVNYVEENEYLCIECENKEVDYKRFLEQEHSDRIYNQYMEGRG